jgi:hypothetical protein
MRQVRILSGILTDQKVSVQAITQKLHKGPFLNAKRHLHDLDEIA